jgi:hypothetical protein
VVLIDKDQHQLAVAAADVILNRKSLKKTD